MTLLRLAVAAVALGALLTRKRRRADAKHATSERCPPAAAKAAAAAGSAMVSLAASSSSGVPTPSGAPLLLQLYQQLCAAFAAEREAGFTISSSQQAPDSFARINTKLRMLISAYIAAGHTDWQAYANWSDLHYVRNLVEENEDFEMMVICWKHGQGSHVHNHADSHGWIAVLSGQISEDRYEIARNAEPAASLPSEAPALPGVLGASSPCPELSPLTSITISKGAIAYINDREALHAVRCAADCPGQGAVSLHIYAPPIRRVHLYEPDFDRVVVRRPGFFTVRGQKA